jgi:hypothetical protein
MRRHTRNETSRMARHKNYPIPKQGTPSIVPTPKNCVL